MDAETRALRAACTTFVHGDGYVPPAALWATVDPTVEPDVYGDEGVVADLETYVADLLDTEAAVFLVSGTMAQGATLRVHADARTSRTVLWHPTSHLTLHERDGPVRLHHLVERKVGSAVAPVTLADVEQVAEPYAALVLELPAREIGGRLPAWDDLVAQTAHARARGAAVHLDGARLWEAAAGYGRSPAEVVSLFDTAYVSFYKGIGALPGCCVVGPAAVVAQVREWRKRMGGTLFGMWPAASSALTLLPERLAEMPGRMQHALAVAAALGVVDGVTVVPTVPEVPMMHLRLAVDAERFAANARALAREHGVWTWAQAQPTVVPGTVGVELSVGRATSALSPSEVASHVASLLA